MPPKKQICKHYPNCNRGDECIFFHPPTGSEKGPKPMLCKYIATTAGCKKGVACKFSHQLPTQEYRQTGKEFLGFAKSITKAGKDKNYSKFKSSPKKKEIKKDKKGKKEKVEESLEMMQLHEDIDKQVEACLAKLTELKTSLENVSIATNSNSPHESDLSFRGWMNSPPIEWLTCSNWMELVELKDSYESVEDYTVILQKLWTQLTFYWAMAAIWPKCRHHQNSDSTSKGIKLCGIPLLTPVAKASSFARGRSKNYKCSVCQKYACDWGCTHPGHPAICHKCVNGKVELALKTHNSADSCTDIYDAVISKMSYQNESIVLTMNEVLSRKPPQAPINWNTTYRLQPPSLVAVICVKQKWDPIQHTARLYWGEIVPMSSAKDHQEGKLRAKGKLAVKVLSRSDCDQIDVNINAFPFRPGSRVAVIDCRLFVPEVMSVLSTLFHQDFQNGLQNLPFIKRILSRPLKENSIAAIPVAINFILRDIISQAIETSTIPYMKYLNVDVKSRLADRICSLETVRSLDHTQLEAFANGLNASFHTTLGPPGSGKVRNKKLVEADSVHALNSLYLISGYRAM